MTKASGQPKKKLQPLVPLGGRSPWSVLPPLIMGFFMIMVDTTIVNVAIPTLVEDLHASIVTVGWVNSAYMLTYASLLLLAGRMGDRFGSRNVFIAGLLVFTAASALCGLSGGIALLIGARAVQGIGAALMTPQTMSMITRVFPPSHRGLAMGLWGATSGVATIAGPVLGGILVQSWGWKWIFFVNIPIGVLALGLALARLPRLQRQVKAMDGVGAVLSLLGLFLLVFGIQEGDTFGWGRIVGPLHVWMVIAAGLLILASFVLWQRKMGQRALMPLALFRTRNFNWANVAGLTINFVMVGMNFPLMIFLQMAMGLQPFQAALVSLPASLISGVAAPLAGRLSDRVPGKWVVAAGFTILTAAISFLAWAVMSDAPIWLIVLPLIAFGIGSSCVFSPLANIATANLDARTAGAGSGTFNTTRQIGGVLGSAVAVAVLTARLAVEVPAAAARLAPTVAPQYRESFLRSFSGTSFTGTTFTGATITDAMPEQMSGAVAETLQSVAQQVLRDGFAAAVGQTLVVTVVAAALGLCAALAMTSRN